jgi:hypothetical protein
MPRAKLGPSLPQETRLSVTQACRRLNLINYVSKTICFGLFMVTCSSSLSWWQASHSHEATSLQLFINFALSQNWYSCCATHPVPFPLALPYVILRSRFLEGCWFFFTRLWCSGSSYSRTTKRCLRVLFRRRSLSLSSSNPASSNTMANLTVSCVARAHFWRWAFTVELVVWYEIWVTLYLMPNFGRKFHPSDHDRFRGLLSPSSRVLLLSMGLFAGSVCLLNSLFCCSSLLLLNGRIMQHRRSSGISLCRVRRRSEHWIEQTP